MTTTISGSIDYTDPRGEEGDDEGWEHRPVAHVDIPLPHGTLSLSSPLFVREEDARTWIAGLVQLLHNAYLTYTPEEPPSPPPRLRQLIVYDERGETYHGSLVHIRQGRKDEEEA